MNETRPIIIKRIKSHGEHHGGAWKVAYADFVTAMMALFIVLWLLNSSKQVQEAVGGYFKDPSGSSKKTGSNQTGSGGNFTVRKDDMPKLKEQLQNAMRQMVNFDTMKNQIEMTVTSEGLRIELLETDTGLFFDSGNPEPNNNGRELLTMLAKELGEMPNKLSIEGHTDSLPFARGTAYGNWELSSDRANAARRIMQNSGIHADQVSQVRGFADQRPRKPNHPEDSSNRRISLIVQYVEKAKGEEESEATPSAEKGSVKEKPAAEPAALP